ncbi:Hypothetical Protein RradSPS_2736 [Rubrobacter radiotolerans]|uniref:Dolichyl-phosphate-mannose-protein mannosyltransferase n=1 Tax=Rubrobacter radiotolerans TaxID=42256 RepID=A0A023X7I7_RUBRA|nr:hypothetical protein [Rubrobacter radiotolerans]AHY48019.1 Hypothetical Protein RradSPS_2736 [Rubrobacter radiotolerans]MDX5892658.1 hypothetical protein [Rubrobacter radiotolerans]SMC08041.1 conserved hypothetical protein [Rubrobacter radiotolerans DSM 5868]
MTEAAGRETKAKAATSRGAVRHLGAALLYLLVALVFTYPLVFNLDRVNGTGDPAVMVWSMAWIQHALTSSASFFDANIFYPTEDALAYTDLLLPSALATLPLYLLTGNPLVNYNVVLLATYVLSGYFVFLLSGRLMRGARFAYPAAVFAGLVYAFCPYRQGHITQLNSMTTYFLPLMLLFLHRYLEDGRRPRDMVALGVLFALNALSGLYYGLFAALMMAVFYVLWSVLNRSLPKGRDFLYGVPVFAVTGVLLALILLPYLQLSDSPDHARSIETAAGGSFIPPALLTSPPESALLGWTPEALGTSNEDGRPMYELTLYPGLAVALLALYGVFRGRPGSGFSGKAPLLYGLLGLAIVIFSLGPFVEVGGTRIYLPYWLLYEFVPGFGNLRVPARMWSIVMVCFAVLAAFGLRALVARLSNVRAAALLAIVTLFTLAEFLPTLPVDRFIDRGPFELEPAYAYLSENAGPGTVVAEVPFASSVDAFRETPRMVRSTYGWWDLVNGYASYFPEGYTETRDALNGLPSGRGAEEMERLGAEYVIVHPDDYDAEGEDGAGVVAAMDADPNFERVAGDSEAVLYRFSP